MTCTSLTTKKNCTTRFLALDVGRNNWKAMTAPCLLHFDGDVATMIRGIDGPHVNAHLNVDTTLATLKPIVDPDICNNLKRILPSAHQPSALPLPARPMSRRTSHMVTISLLLKSVSSYRVHNYQAEQARTHVTNGSANDPFRAERSSINSSPCRRHHTNVGNHGLSPTAVFAPILAPLSSGLTFGDSTSPSNWEPIARARKQFAQHLWHDGDAIAAQAAEYLPTFILFLPVHFFANPPAISIT